MFKMFKRVRHEIWRVFCSQVRILLAMTSLYSSKKLFLHIFSKVVVTHWCNFYFYCFVASGIKIYFWSILVLAVTNLLKLVPKCPPYFLNGMLIKLIAIAVDKQTNSVNGAKYGKPNEKSQLASGSWAFSKALWFHWIVKLAVSFGQFVVFIARNG